MDPLAAFVARYAPDIVGAAEAPDDAVPEARVDPEVVRSLADIWIAGPPYEPRVERCRRRLASGGGDLTDLTSAPTIILRTRLGPERLVRLTADVRRRVARHDHAPRRRLLLAVGAAVLMLIGFALRDPGTDQHETVEPPPVPITSAPPETQDPVEEAAVARRTHEILVDVELTTWMARLRTAVFAELDPRTELLGQPEWQPAVHSESGPEGQRATAAFGLAIQGHAMILDRDEKGRSPRMGVLVVATPHGELVPICGLESRLTCRPNTGPGGRVLWVGSNDTLVEVVHRFSQDAWVYVRVEATNPGMIDVDQVVELAQDRRLRAPL